jgi:hypothetical protein
MVIPVDLRAESLQALAVQPGEGRVGHFAPAVIEDQGVTAVGEREVVGGRPGLGVELVGGLRDNFRLEAVMLCARKDDPSLPGAASCRTPDTTRPGPGLLGGAYLRTGPGHCSAAAPTTCATPPQPCG